MFADQRRKKEEEEEKKKIEIGRRYLRNRNKIIIQESENAHDNSPKTILYNEAKRRIAELEEENAKLKQTLTAVVQQKKDQLQQQ